MDELGAILSAWRRLRENPGAAVLATVVHVEGSAYRRPGARMLICDDGRCVGSISGGCLEGDVTKKAAWWTADGRTALRVYDTSSEEAAWEFGLGCNGVITLMLERVASNSNDEALAFLDTKRRTDEDCALAVVIRAEEHSGLAAGDRLLFDVTGVRGGAAASCAAARHLTAACELALATRTSRLLHMGNADVFVEFVPARQKLIVFGAGHDARPLVTMAAGQGWAVTVADGRPTYARADRFPEAESVVVLPADADLSSIGFGSEAAVVMMTHNFPQDERLLPAILARRPRYLGMLGPRRRAEALFARIGQDPALRSVHAPAGLDVGGDSPAAIALAIVAEILCVLEGREGGPLRQRSGPIHAAPEEVGGGLRATAEETENLAVCGVSL